MDHSRKKLELTGQRFGKLTVIAPAENVDGRTAWLCRCQCGRERVVKTCHLRDGHATSYGCKPCGSSSLTYVDGATLEMLQAKRIRKNSTSGADMTLLIMAAGIGSRFGGGIKQLETVGTHGEIIMDYSIHDALEAGFNKIAFIIRKDIEEDFRQVIGNRIEAVCQGLGVEVQYAYQSLDALPEGYTVPGGRKKPWGTGQAVLAAKELLQEPFAVINADDYYGKEAFRKVHDFLLGYDPERPMDFCMAGFILKNTLSDHGSVTRGICQVDGNDFLTDVVETKGIVKTETGAAAGGEELDALCHVSMNMWGLTPEFLPVLEQGFTEFLENNDAVNGEYLLPTCIGQLLREERITVKMLETHDKWFGVTYQEDREGVAESIKRLTEEGVYGENLFADLHCVLL